VGNKRLWRAIKREPHANLPYPDNPLANDTIPPSILSAIPSEYLATAKRLIERKLLVMRQSYTWHIPRC
jgi:hypothetical protein